MPWNNLAHLACLDISGIDACTLLQGLSTNNVKAVTQEQAGFHAFCNQKGRVLASGLLCLIAENHYRFITCKDNLEALSKHLCKFRLRSKAEITCLKQDIQGCVGLADQTIKTALNTGEQYLTDGESCYCYDALTPRFIRWTSGTETTKNNATSSTGNDQTNTALSDWYQHDIASNIVLISAQLSSQFTPHMLGYPEAGWVSFNKGCYLGQEIVARTEHLGTAKKSLIQYRHDTSKLTISSPCLDDTTIVGSILVSSNYQSLALIDHKALAKPIKVEENGQSITLKPKD